MADDPKPGEPQKPGAGAEPASGAKPGGEAQPAPGAKPVTGAQPVAAPPSVDERIDGLRAWVAQLDRKLGIRSYAGGAALVLALAAGIVAIVLVLGVKEDSATTEELDRLRGEVAGVEESASQAAEDDVASLTTRVEALESQLQTLRSGQDATDREISVLTDDVADLRDDISAIDTSTGSTDTDTDTDTP